MTYFIYCTGCLSYGIVISVSQEIYCNTENSFINNLYRKWNKAIRKECVSIIVHELINNFLQEQRTIINLVVHLSQLLMEHQVNLYF